ncbi:PBSX family phage terminase large subunit [Aureimonas sp. N4]|uniref:PBSX family phage terminase large subunit n=1 Tax=Aureimonas sp. N4 TaxID=1638165 RepID=UPI00078298FC|nr:phage terminase large subunit [Aureimonas sp. N4]
MAQRSFTSSQPRAANLALPPKLLPVFAQPRGAVQYRGAYGGRGSGKSFNFAKMAAVWGYVEPLRVLATREFQASIKESFHAELKAAIASEPWLDAHYDVGVDYLRGRNGTEFIFRGLRHGVSSIKSLAKIDLTIVEEAEDVPEASWLALEATVFRQPKSEMWVIWNPRREAYQENGQWTGSPADARFRKRPPASSQIVEMNWQDNPFFPSGLDILRRRELERLDPNTYAHVWEGGYLTNSDAQVFAGKWEIREFEPEPTWDGPYQGGDFGFAQDPTAGIRCYVSEETLYVSDEAGKVGLELDDTAPFLIKRIPGFDRYVTRWDSARPESISHLKRHGLQRSEAVEKWKGSVEDGIAFLRSFRRIVIHSRCVETAREMRLYSYKVDRLTGDILPTLVDAHNHYIDALRYAVAPMIKRAGEVAMFLTRRNR